MILFLILGVILFVILSFLYFSRVKVNVCYEREAKNDKGEVRISWIAGLHYRLTIPTVDFKNPKAGVKVESEKKSNEEEKDTETFINIDKLKYWYDNYEELLYRVRSFQDSVRWFMARIHCEKWVWKTIVGTGDAAEAGVLTGVVWGVKTNILGFISHYIQWDREPELEVIPSFQQSKLDTSFQAVFSFTVGSYVRFMVFLWISLRLSKFEKKPQVLPRQKSTNF